MLKHLESWKQVNLCWLSLAVESLNFNSLT